MNVTKTRAAALAAVTHPSRASAEAEALQDLQALIDVGWLASYALDNDVLPELDQIGEPEKAFARYFEIMRRTFHGGHLTDLQCDLLNRARQEGGAA